METWGTTKKKLSAIEKKQKEIFTKLDKENILKIDYNSAIFMKQFVSITLLSNNVVLNMATHTSTNPTTTILFDNFPEWLIPFIHITPVFTTNADLVRDWVWPYDRVLDSEYVFTNDDSISNSRYNFYYLWEKLNTTKFLLHIHYSGRVNRTSETIYGNDPLYLNVNMYFFNPNIYYENL